jgi:predicted MFS family arabinose efflux permease
MTALDVGGDDTQQVIQVTIETYLAAFAQASGKTYLSQSLYDSGDQSAKAAIAIANGVSGIVGNTPTGRNFYGPGVRIEPRTNNPQL